jgi:hypothetical protein
MRNERAGDPLSCRQMSPILTRWREWWCALTESSGSQVTPRRSEADSNPRSRSCERARVLPKGGPGTTS